MSCATNSALARQNPRIREAQPQDIEVLAQLINAAFVVEQVAFDGDRIDAGGVSALMDTGVFLVAEETAGATGCVYVEVQGERSYLGLLSVVPARQGAGLGRELVTAAEEYSRNAKSRTMDLRIISPRAEQLLPFYLHLGYTLTNSAAPLSCGPADKKPKVPCHYILMTRPLT